MAHDTVKLLLVKPIHLSNKLIKSVAESPTFKQQQFTDLKSNAERLLNLLRQADRTTSDLFELITKRMVDNIVYVLFNALKLILKCRSNRSKRDLSISYHSGNVKKISGLLESCIGDVSWLLKLSVPPVVRGHLGLPPIAVHAPILGLIWELIAVLHTGSVDDRAEAAESLAELAMDNDRYRELIVEEGGVAPLLKLVKDGMVEEQQNAVRAIEVLGNDSETLRLMIAGDMCMFFTNGLKDRSVKVRNDAAWAIAELSRSYPNCLMLFGQSVVKLLVSLLAHPVIKSCDILKSMSAIVSFAALLRTGSEHVQYYSAFALMEITAMADKHAGLQRSGFSPNDTACVVEQLLNIINNGDSNSVGLLILGNFAKTFRSAGLLGSVEVATEDKSLELEF